MSYQLIWVLTLLLVAIFLFTTNRVRMDVVALLVIIAFVLSGTLTLPEATAGFSDPNVILIAALFVIGEGLVRTGVAYQVGEWLMRVAGQNETRMLILLMLTVALLGAVMSSSGVVAIFIPVVLRVSSRMKTSPSRMMMPLSFAALISGMMTLVATPPNMVVNSELVRDGVEGFGFFAVTPVGVVVLIMGVGYMLLARYWLGGGEGDRERDQWTRRTFRDLIRDYKLTGRARRLAVRAGSPLIGQRLDDLRLRDRYGANVVGIERWRKFRRVMISAGGNTELHQRDVLLIDMTTSENGLRQFCGEQQLEPMVLRGEYFSEQARDVGMAEVSLIPDSELIGKSLSQVGFRSRYGVNVVGIRRNAQAMSGKLIDEELSLGDILLVIGDWKLIRQLQIKKNDFILLNLPAEVDDVAPAISQAPHALFCLALMVAMMLSEAIPNPVAALITCVLMGKFRCIDMESAYHAIHWPSLILIVGMMPFALALQKTGGVDLMVRLLMEISGGAGAHVMLLSLFILCATIGLFISNTATAVLMAPIAVAAAREMAVSPYPFAMIIAIAASSAFMTPVSSPVNTLVLVPGGYKFSDFLRIGVPFTIMVMVVSVVLVPMLYPF
ncbi:SLC13 family permease [Acerihabitans sp. TG2]|uniref:SLC13 family permease n=1 Tax=Acerihabitans sp. TG2 TaxID=3096008 RepID=UPI002B23DF40|nr:SLC13 family permease [Acerihabitans sp. TG2]MEA9389144.1 SLC13 family permease [Acerihabitans sp. TG2]